MKLDALQNALPAYVIERELGGGGMARVFLAQDRSLGRRVVIKLLSEELASGLSGERFKREIQVVAQLQHPNIVPLLSAGEVDGLPYYTMPFVDGESLRARISRAGELSIPEALRLLRDVARALDHAHEHGVMHRDIKPDNVLVSGDYAVVTDFGVGKALTAARKQGDETLTHFGVAVGTPAYMAPEQASGDTTVDQRADIYAFGCLAYEMLTGAPPFSGRSPHELFAAHMTAAPPPILERRASIPESLAALVMRCLEKRPADRPQSARELVQSLEAVSTPATGTGLGPRLLTVSHRRRVSRLAVIAAAASLVVVAAIAIAKLRGSSNRPVNESLITVLPFRVSAADPALRYLREGMMDLIAAKLTGAYRAVDPRTVLTAWRREGGSESTDLAEPEALAVARSLQAGRVLQGEIVGNTGQLVVSGRIIDVASGTARAHARVQGAAGSLALLVDSLVGKLLVLESGGDEEQSVMLSGIPFTALEAYLSGQRAYRMGRYTAAIDEYLKAIRIDSTFAQAALMARVAAGWTLDPRPTALVPMLRRYREKLSDRDKLTLDVAVGGGRPSTCREGLAQQEAAIARATDVPELWYYLGDNLMHCGEVMALPNPHERALGAFEKAIALDSGFIAAWEHVPGIHLWSRGDTAAARRTFAEYAKHNPELVHAWNYLLFADSAERERMVPAMIANPSVYFGVFGAVFGPMFWPRSLRISERVLEGMKRRAITEADRQRLLQAERVLALNRGQPERAARVARLETAYPTSRRILDGVFHDGDSVLAAAAAGVARRAMESGLRPTAREAWADWVDDVWAVGVYDGAHGRADGVAKAAAALRSMQAPADSPWVADGARRSAMLLEAQHAVLTRSARARELTAAADSMLREGPPGVLRRAGGNLLVASLWERLGDTPRAYDAAKRVYFEPTFTPFWSTFRRERARLAALVGNTEDAIKHYREYVQLRYEPEPSLRAHMESVRRELARLEQRSAGR